MKAEEAEKMKNALLKGGAAWDIGKKSRNEKRDRAQGGKRSKKARLKKLVGWGEKGEEALNTGDWLIGKKEEEEVPVSVPTPTPKQKKTPIQERRLNQRCPGCPKLES